MLKPVGRTCVWPWEQMLRPWQEGPLCELDRAWSGPAGMEGFLSTQVCGATRQASAQGSQACFCPSSSSLAKSFWVMERTLGREGAAGQGLKGAAGSYFSGSPHSAWAIPACFEYKHAICSFLVCSNQSYQLAGLYLHGSFVPKPTNVSKIISVLFRGACSYWEECARL